MNRIAPWLLMAGRVGCGTSDTSNEPTDAGNDTDEDIEILYDVEEDTDEDIEILYDVEEDIEILYDVEEDGGPMPVDTGIAPTCDSAVACGGDPAGNFRFGEYCPVRGPSEMSSCAEAFTLSVVEPDGDFNLSPDGTYSLSVSMNFRYESWAPLSCVSMDTCAELGGRQTDGYCVTILAQDSGVTEQAGTWDTGGSLLHFEPTDESPYDMEYCVTDTGMTLIVTEDDMRIVMFLDRMR